MSSEPDNASNSFPNHQDCEVLTGITIGHVPRDGSLGTVREYRKGHDIWRPGDRADRLYFLQLGQVAEMSSDVDGHELIHRLIEPGQPFGELCFCIPGKGVRQSIGRALTDSQVLEIQYGDFLRYLQSHMDALNALVFTFCERLSAADHRLRVLAHRGADERLGTLLLQLAAHRGHPSLEDRRHTALHSSHDELARLAAMSRSHVTVTMGRFRRLGLVRYGRDRPLLIDVAALTSYLARDRKERSPSA